MTFVTFKRCNNGSFVCIESSLVPVLIKRIKLITTTKKSKVDEKQQVYVLVLPLMLKSVENKAATIDFRYNSYENVNEIQVYISCESCRRELFRLEGISPRGKKPALPLHLVDFCLGFIYNLTSLIQKHINQISCGSGSER